MHGLDIVRMVVSAGASHAFGLDVVGHDLGKLREGFAADCTFPVLLNDLPVHQLPHLGGRPEFPISPRMVWIFYTLNTKLKSAFFPSLLTTAAEQRAMN